MLEDQNGCQLCRVICYSPLSDFQLNSPFVIERFTNVEIVVLEVGDDLLGILSSLLLEDWNTFWVLLCESLFDGLHVSLEMREVLLLVERGLLKSEGVDDVDDLLSTVLKGLGLLLCRWVAANVNISFSYHDLGCVQLVDNIIDELVLVGVRAPVEWNRRKTGQNGWTK